jgi:tRNA threonylcarbamoyladenosine biosynthesis protein TsaE
MAMGLGVRAPVTSPTFTLIHEYAGRRPLYHVDLYRIRSAAEAVQAGLDEYLEADGITVIEWAERAAEVLPPQAIRIRFESMSAENDRRIEIRHQDSFSLAD